MPRFCARANPNRILHRPEARAWAECRVRDGFWRGRPRLTGRQPRRHRARPINFPLALPAPAYFPPGAGFLRLWAWTFLPIWYIIIAIW